MMSFGLQVLYDLSVSPIPCRHRGQLLLHDIPIMRGRLHYRHDDRRNYKSTQDCEPTVHYASPSIVSMV